MNTFFQVLLEIVLSITAIFLILLVLIQRGRGGGLAGAFGGAGGQSAFGTKAGDLFTRITIGAAAFWIILCAVSDKMLSPTDQTQAPGLGRSTTAPVDRPGAAAPNGATETTPGAAATASEGKDAATTTPAATVPDLTEPATTPPAETMPAAGEAVGQAPAPPPAKTATESGADSLPPGSLGPTGAVLPQQPLPTTSEQAAPATPSPAAPSPAPAAPSDGEKPTESK